MSLADHYDRRASIQRVTLTYTDTEAAATEATEDVSQDVECAIQPLTARELELFGKTSAEVTHRAFLAYTEDVRPRDRLVEGNPIETLLGISSTRHEIEGVVDASGKGRHRELMLRELVTEEVDGG